MKTYEKRKCRYDVVQRTAVSVINVMDFRFFFFLSAFWFYEHVSSDGLFNPVRNKNEHSKFHYVGFAVFPDKKMTRHKYCAKASSQISWLIKGEIY